MRPRHEQRPPLDRCPVKIGLCQFAVRHLSDEDKQVIEDACRTGFLPDGRVASQNRLATYLGFSRQTIVNHLKGRLLSRHIEAQSDGARNAAYVRAMRRVATMQQSARVRRVRP